MLSPNAPWPSCEITVWSPTGTTPYLCARYVDPAKKLPRMTPIQPSVTAAFLDSGGLKARSEEHTSELQSRSDLVCRLLLEKKKQLYNCVGIHSALRPL